MPYIYKSGLQFGINETNIYGGASYVELTQAEYDALSDAEKHNGQIYFITDGNYDFLIVNDSVPVGSIQAYGGLTAPNNWLICDGSAVSRTDYKELFQIIGVTYGEGDGLTTFNLPDLTGRVAIGPNTAHLLGTSGGQEEHIHTTGDFTLGINHMPSHNHNSRSLTGNITAYRWDNGVTSGIVHNTANTKNMKTIGAGDVIAHASYTINATHTHDAQGGGQAHNHGDTGSTSNMQPYLVTNYIIKAKNPSITSGQQLQAMELFYPVGSYFETSDSTFDPNTEWGGTWEFENNIYRTAAWTASSSTALNTVLTETIANVPSGTYIIDIAYPVLSTMPFASSIRVNGQEANKYLYQYSGSNTSIIIKLTDENNSISLGSSQSSSCNMSYLERGGLTLYNLTNSSKYKWHRTA